MTTTQCPTSHPNRPYVRLVWTATACVDHLVNDDLAVMRALQRRLALRGAGA